MDSKYQGFVIKKVNYKDNDGIITILTKEGLVSFLARSILKANNKNAACCNLFMYGEYSLTYNTEVSNKTLKSGTILRLHKKSFTDLLVSASCTLMCEIIADIGNDIYTFDYLENALNLLENDAVPLDVLNFFLKNIVNDLGFKSDLSGCSICNSKTNLITFDLKSGGFICLNCNRNENLEVIKNDVLKEIYAFMKSDELINLSGYAANKILKAYLSFINDEVGLKLNSHFFLLNIIKKF